MRSAPAALSALGARTGLRRMLLAYLLFSIVEIATWLAVILYAFAEGGAVLTGVAAVAMVLPAAIVVPAVGGLGDGMRRGTALVASYAMVAIAAAATAAALASGSTVLLVVIGAALVTMASSVARPAHFAAMPQLCRSPDELVSANALSSVADGLGLFVGPLLAGFGVAWAGAASVFACGTVLVSVAMLLCLRLGLAAPERTATRNSSAWREAFGGVAALSSDRAALALLLVLTIRFVVAGTMDVLAVSFSVDILGNGASGAGTLLAAIGIGGLLGGFVAGALVVRRVLSPVVALGGVLIGLAVASVALTTRLGPAAACLLVAGVGGSVLMVAGRTLLQRVTDDRLLARIFAVQEGTSLLGFAVGAAIAPVLVQRLSPAAAFVPVGVGAVVLTLLGFVLMRRLDARAVPLPREVALLRRVPFLALLAEYDLERLARASTWLEVAAGEVVIRQGDPGDLFYVVDSGEYEVCVDDVPRSPLLAAGDSFGEVALLRDVPRTASVRTRVGGRLLTVDSEAFLAAVTGSVDGQAIAAEITAAHSGDDLMRPER